MSKHMEKDLDRLQRAVLRMAAAVENAVGQATRALRDRDAELARSVIADDTAVDRLENEIQEECLKILALHQPVAVDLRRVNAVLLISTDLERMGDLAVAIADRALHAGPPPHPDLPDRIDKMSGQATGMVRRSLEAFVNHDPAAARAVIRTDDDVDRDNAAIIHDLIAEMKRSADRVETGLSLFSAVRHIERIADHATNIAEDVIYLVEGRVVRHERPVSR